MWRTIVSSTRLTSNLFETVLRLHLGEPLLALARADARQRGTTPGLDDVRFDAEPADDGGNIKMMPTMAAVRD